jgi:hypothetical protein
VAWADIRWLCLERRMYMVDVSLDAVDEGEASRGNKVGVKSDCTKIGGGPYSSGLNSGPAHQG